MVYGDREVDLSQVRRPNYFHDFHEILIRAERRPRGAHNGVAARDVAYYHKRQTQLLTMRGFWRGQLVTVQERSMFFGFLEPCELSILSILSISLKCRREGSVATLRTIESK